MKSKALIERIHEAAKDIPAEDDLPLAPTTVLDSIRWVHALAGEINRLPLPLPWVSQFDGILRFEWPKTEGRVLIFVVCPDPYKTYLFWKEKSDYAILQHPKLSEVIEWIRWFAGDEKGRA